MQTEQWVEIPNFSRYRVSDYGRIWNVIFERLMVPSVATSQGNLKISLIDDEGIRRSCSVPVLVAQAFVQPPNDRSDYVILLDGDMNNVAAPNLAWRTHRQAYLYARQMRTPQPDSFYYIPIRNLDTGERFDSIYQCGITYGLVFAEIFGSCAARQSRPPRRQLVYPFAHQYEIIPIDER